MDLRQLEGVDLKNKKVLVRLDLNVPLKDGVITDETRITKALPTLRYILGQTNKVAVMSHLGRPKGEVKKEFSLEVVGERISQLLEKEVLFVEDFADEPIEQIFAHMDSNQFIRLENLRFDSREKKNDLEFSQHLSSGFDVYVNDAFGTVHRAHSSVVGVAEQFTPENRFAGFLIKSEIEALSKVKNHPKAPFTVVMGGSKVSDKITVILNLMNVCNNMLIGGAMAYTFLKYKGFDVGNSRVEEDKMDLVEKIYENAKVRKVQIHLPVDHIAASEFSEAAEPVACNSENIPEGLMGLDVGPKTQKEYAAIIADSNTVLWNGPMGVFEWSSFANGSIAVADAMAANERAYTVVGGGDSVSATNLAGVSEKMSHVSTGGGASLEYLEGKTLPGLKVLTK